jgi:hypothetical protein
MKSMKRLSFITLVVVFILTSCTLQKRIYRSGYHVEWHKAAQHESKEEFAVNNEGKEPQTLAIPSEQVSSHNSTVDSSPTADNTLSSAPFDHPEAAPRPSSEKSASDRKKTSAKSQPAVLKQLKTTLKKRTTPSSSQSSESGAGAFRALGWTAFLSGVVTIIYVSILLGILVLLLALIFALIAASISENTPPKPVKAKENPQYIDVVYLNNGSIIRGIIIEMVPNVSLKIQTRDGSVFFYKMEEVQKMTKEPVG